MRPHDFQFPIKRKIHTYGLFVLAAGRWRMFRAVCSPVGMNMCGRANYELDEDEVDKWRVWVMEDYEERTGLEIMEE